MNRIIGISGALGLALPGSLAAQDPAPPDRLEPDEIVVTGERIPRLEMETASSVVVLTSADLEASSADRLDQILALVPNVQLGSGEEGPAIRGQDSTGQLRNLFAFFGAARPRVTLQVDGRAVSFYEFISGSQSIWDVKQVEVFRSPQTTTQGRNSIAGAIFVTTQSPSEQWEGRGRVIVGDESMQQFSAALSGPIVKDELAFRLSGDLRLAEVANDMTDGVVGANINRDEFGTARLKFLYQPATWAGARIETTLAYTHSQSPQFEGASRPFDERRLPIPNQMIGVMKVRATSLTTRADYEIAQGLQGALAVSYGDAVLRRFGLPGLGRARANTNDLSIEPTLLWNGSDDFSLLVGANRYAMDQVQTIDISGFGLGAGTFNDQQDSLGLFGEATWHPVAFIALTGGLRYEEDRQVRVGGIGGILLDFDRTFDALLPKFAIAFNQGEDLSIGLTAQRAFNPGGVSISLLRRAADEFGAETLWNYEAFIRARMANGKVRLKANAFYSDIQNAQRPQLTPVQLPNGIFTQVVEFANAPAAHTYGFEFELDWKLRQNLDLRFGLGLLETKVDQTQEPGDRTLGKSFQRSPGFTASGSVNWNPVEKLQLTALVRHHSGYFSDDANTEALRIGATTIVDGRASYDFGRFAVFGYARNLFDDFYLTNLFNENFASTGKPRELGVGIEARF